MKKATFVLVVFFLLASAFFAGRFFSKGGDFNAPKLEREAASIIQPQKKYQQEKIADTHFGEVRIKGKF